MGRRCGLAAARPRVGAAARTRPNAWPAGGHPAGRDGCCRRRRSRLSPPCTPPISRRRHRPAGGRGRVLLRLPDHRTRPRRRHRPVRRPAWRRRPAHALAATPTPWSTASRRRGPSSSSPGWPRSSGASSRARPCSRRPPPTAWPPSAGTPAGWSPGWLADFVNVRLDTARTAGVDPALAGGRGLRRVGGGRRYGRGGRPAPWSRMAGTCLSLTWPANWPAPSPP